jgi:hypothetical protein
MIRSQLASTQGTDGIMSRATIPPKALLNRKRSGKAKARVPRELVRSSEHRI